GVDDKDLDVTLGNGLLTVRGEWAGRPVLIAPAAISRVIRAELPTLLNLYSADRFLLKKIATSAFMFLEEVRADENHPLRREFDRFVASFVAKIASSPEYAARLHLREGDVLGRTEIQ